MARIAGYDCLYFCDSSRLGRWHMAPAPGHYDDQVSAPSSRTRSELAILGGILTMMEERTNVYVGN